MLVAALLVAAGSGTRFGAALPKQFAILAGLPVLRHAAEALMQPGGATLLQPVGDATAIDAALNGLDHLPVVPGGRERQDSVRAGLEALAPHAPDIVLVHDGARPVIPAGTIPALLAALEASPGAIPGAPVSDTLKLEVAGSIARTVPRTGLVRAQTPQAFRFPILLDLHRATAGGAATDDAGLLEEAGLQVAIIPGSESNVKITFAADLARLEHAMSSIPGRDASPPMLPRVGTGFDVHVLQSGRRLMLCGIEVPHDQGLAGHSDADVGIHALCDAIYGAMADGDIGRHFPPSENRWKDADSARFLQHAAARVRERGGILANVDVTLICEQPKITPHAPAMRQRLAELMDVPLDRVSVKATTTERLGFAGRGEGIAAQAAAMVLLPA